MRWFSVALFGIFFLSASNAAAAQFSLAHVWPNIGIVLVGYVALRRGAIESLLWAIYIGYLVGRMSHAPLGAFEFSFGLLAMVTYNVSEQVQPGGVWFFALGAAAGHMVSSFVLMALLWSGGFSVGFPNWWTASQVPAALMTAFAALLLWPLLQGIERRVSTSERPGVLSWS